MTVQTTKITATETTRLLSDTPDDAASERGDYGSSSSDCENVDSTEASLTEPKPYSDAYIARVVGALLIGKPLLRDRQRLSNVVGVFTSNADASLVMATHPVIASEFGDLEDSSWLFISFMLAGAATQSLVSWPASVSMLI